MVLVFYDAKESKAEVYVVLFDVVIRGYVYIMRLSTSLEYISDYFRIQKNPDRTSGLRVHCLDGRLNPVFYLSSIGTNSLCSHTVI